MPPPDARAPFSHTPLTPAAYLVRAGAAYGTRTAIVDGDRTVTYAEFLARSRRLAGALERLDVGTGDRVAALCANSQLMLELHNALPMRGAVLVPLNVRLSADEHHYIAEHAGVSALFATVEFADRARSLARQLGVPVVVEGAEYEELLARAHERQPVRVDEHALLAINYTSGTTGTPKGVMYSHRGAALQAVAMAFQAGLHAGSRYLWTLPMFHCNGWSFTWAVTAAGGVHHCLRAVDPRGVWDAFRNDGVTHFSGAPTVLAMIATAPEAAPLGRSAPVRAQTGGAPPSPALLATTARLGIEVTHLYGMTETYGPIVINDWDPRWADLHPDEQARLRARQGVGNVLSDPPRVVDASGVDVPPDGVTVGEIVVRGNNVMLGYYRDSDATAAATLDGHLRTGDLAVMHPDGYIEITDRSKDVIIAGGENIASVEVERVIEELPGVLEAAVVAMPDEKWGQLPAAFVTLRGDASLTEEEIVAHVRKRLAHYKTPRRIIFGAIPKTSTGKIRKNELRDRLAVPAS